MDFLLKKMGILTSPDFITRQKSRCRYSAHFYKFQSLNLSSYISKLYGWKNHIKEKTMPEEFDQYMIIRDKISDLIETLRDIEDDKLREENTKYCVEMLQQFQKTGI
ncbi:hypothetical protein A3860_17805 [Niastella vici]|uniref:Uncharacterized protein n=2 Tax=Niastella vici TaxID=1703345 RepID=A0A1V9G4M7_9BACT|nr:hypothetical protein A3860_17805 [Niastella vici]